MRHLSATALLAASLSAFAGAFPPAHRIDLDRPDALEQVRLAHPGHAQRIAAFLARASYQMPETMAGWLRTEFDAREVSSAMLIKTSNPPQARVEFVLDDTKYVSTVTLKNAGGFLQPARPQTPLR